MLLIEIDDLRDKFGVHKKEALIADFGSLLLIRTDWSTALSVPLGISRPRDTCLVAWALRLSRSGGDPECVLAVARPRLANIPSNWTVTTHFGPVDIVAQPAERDRVIPSEVAPFVIRALLQAVASHTVAAISEALVAMPVAVHALRQRERHVIVGRGVDGCLRIEEPLDFLPGHAVIRFGQDLRIVPVHAIDFVFEEREFAAIGLDVSGVPAIDEVVFLLGEWRLAAVLEAPADVR